MSPRAPSEVWEEGCLWGLAGSITLSLVSHPGPWVAKGVAPETGRVHGAMVLQTQSPGS